MLTRRKFIGSTLGAGAVLAAGVQPSAAQKRIIVDSQIHIWKADSPDFPWIPGVKPQLPEPFTFERAVALMDEAGVHRAVIVPAGLSWSNSYALEAVKRHPDRFAVMGRMRLNDPKNAELLPNWKKQPGMLGVRQTINSPKLLEEAMAADWFWSGAEKAGLPVMFFAAGQIAAFDKIAARHPGLPLIIDHLGLTGVIAKEGRAADAIGQVVALAKYPNVSVKMSNLPGSSLEPYPFPDLTPHLQRVFEAYGPQRCHWGTDITNGLARVDWKQRLAHFTQELKFMSESDKDQVLGRSILQKLNWKA